MNWDTLPLRGSRVVRLLLTLGLVIGSAPAALGTAGLSEMSSSRAAWLKRPYALVRYEDSPQVRIERARDARWNDVETHGGAIVSTGLVSGLGLEAVGPFAVVGSRFVFRFDELKDLGALGFRFDESEDFGVLDMDRPDAEVERLSRAELIATLGAVPEFTDFDAYYAAHWSWPNPANVLVGWTAIALMLVVLLTVFVAIPFTIAWIILRCLRRLAPRAFVPLFGRRSSVDPRP